MLDGYKGEIMKIGDKVRIKKDKDIPIGLWNEEAIITSVNDDGRYGLNIFPEGYVINPFDIELIEEYKPRHIKESPVCDVKCAEDEKVVEHRSVCNKLNAIYKQKNEKYGDSFGISVKKYGLISALTRISDKFNRFEQLVLEGSNGTDDETLLDTCLDTANYFIMTAIELQEKGK